MSHCEEMYLRALADPFDPEIQGEVCYPSFPAKKSVKYIGQQTVNVYIGTNGFGWLAYDLTPGNTALTPIAYTDATYAGTAASLITTTAGSGVVTATWGTPTASSAFTESTEGLGNQFRVVIGGAKFRYTGTELNRGGSVFAVTAPQQDSLIGFMLGNCAEPTLSRELPVISSYQTVVLPPSHEEDVEWKDGDQLFPWSDGGGITSNPLQALVFVGTPGNSFVVRLIEHYEVAGNSFNMFGTMSHIGRQQLIQSITTAASSATYGAPSQGRSYLQQFAHGLRRIADSPVVRKAASFVATLGGEYIKARLTRGAGSRMERIGFAGSGSRRIGYSYTDVD